MKFSVLLLIVVCVASVSASMSLLEFKKSGLQDRVRSYIANKNQSQLKQKTADLTEKHLKVKAEPQAVLSKAAAPQSKAAAVEAKPTQASKKSKKDEEEQEDNAEEDDKADEEENSNEEEEETPEEEEKPSKNAKSEAPHAPDAKLSTDKVEKAIENDKDMMRLQRKVKRNYNIASMAEKITAKALKHIHSEEEEIDALKKTLRRKLRKN